MKTLLFIIIILISSINFAQEINKNKEQPFIEVIGTSIQEVVPDMIFIEINLSEKAINRKNYTIVEQESNLRAKLNTLNISLDKLALSDSNSIILRNKRRETGVKLTKEFILLVHTSEEVTHVFRALNDININEASIIKTEHSKITDIRKEVRIEAIKAAKEKAQYLLEAIDEELGQPIEVREYNSRKAIVARSNFSSNTALNIVTSGYNQQIAFETFDVKFSYYIKYEIKK
ncbi:hypothetical protein A9Q86_03400 [Flavobacteriales bacterium 33_180_T64]|nr:hypothetical protein A9Q86_03400 [Flavobacteriales bacterium 33_180_T64]